ncbi:hypothetical protein GMRT_22704 [Giardia muris]|uniref:Uncharacterized protein n=1 Tax=Giardia muris TaxID=5742 RepID=A0A4Z1SSY0_GIAMU|nr:hypothetical protein GMRT_22704 [Giardia muris]|eukprot:TNJ29036.1 hypothetical protein GMRT_22704 [Giardia muris]
MDSQVLLVQFDNRVHDALRADITKLANDARANRPGTRSGYSRESTLDVPIRPEVAHSLFLRVVERLSHVNALEPQLVDTPYIAKLLGRLRQTDQERVATALRALQEKTSRVDRPLPCLGPLLEAIRLQSRRDSRTR